MKPRNPVVQALIASPKRNAGSHFNHTRNRREPRERMPQDFDRHDMHGLPETVRAYWIEDRTEDD
jgi:hypothetical protein